MTTANASFAVGLALAATTMLAGVQSAGNPASPGQSGGPPPPDAVTVVDTALPALMPDANGEIQGTVFVANPAKVERTVSIAMGLRTAFGMPIEVKPADITPATQTVPASTALQGLKFSAAIPDVAALSPEMFPLTGWIAVTTAADSRDPASVPRSKAIEIKSILGRGPAADWPLLERALLAALVATLLAAIVAAVRDGVGVLFHRMGGPTWSFTDSWSSTLTVAGAMFTAVIGFAGLPDQGHIFSKRTYGILSLTLTGLIGLAPGVYNVFRKPVTHTVGTATVVQYQGFVLFFLVAALFTMTGVVAQLGVLRALFADIAAASVLSTTTADAFGLLFDGLQALLLLYAVVSIAQTLHAQSAPPAWKAGVAAVRPDALAQRLPDWSLL
jgi:hypothetical protein